MTPPDEPGWLEGKIRAWGKKRNREHEARRFCSHFYHKVPAIRALHDSGIGRRCFIIGNGPSLNKVDLQPLRNESTFGVNSIFLNFDKMGFKPTYYVIEDALVAHDRASIVNTIRGMTKIFPVGLKDVLSPDEDTVYANVIYDYASYPGFPDFSLDASRCLWVGGTVTYLCLQLAFYMGFDPVILVGVDHSYNVDLDKNDLRGRELTSKADDENHFHRDYFGNGLRWHVPNVERMEKAYRRAREVYERHGRTVINATAGGKLEVFPRRDFQSVTADATRPS